MTHATRLTVDVVDTDEGLRRLAPSWNLLAAGCRTPFQSYVWNLTWWELVGSRSGSHRLHVLSVRNDGKLVAIAPLMIDRRDGRRILTFLSSPWNDYGDILIGQDSDQVVAAVWRSLTDDGGRRFDSVELAEIPPWSPLLGPPRAADGQAAPSISAASVCPRRKLDFQQHRFKASTRQKLRMLARHGEPRLRILTLEPDVVAALPDFVTMHVRQWYGRPDCGLTFTQPEMARFYRESIPALSAAGLLGLIELRCDQTPVAYAYGFLHARTFWSYRPAYETAISKASPGSLLHILAFEELAGEGFETFDFMRGDYGYKTRFANESVLNKTIRLESGARIGGAHTRKE